MADRDAFIAAMRQVASSVTVVTTDGPAGAAGATVSAFSSLSADPPSVLVCLRSGSRIARAVTANEAFCVNVLPEHASGTAQTFAGHLDHLCDDRFQGIALTSSRSGPVLDGATAFICTVGNTLVHGTHTIIVGNAMDIQNTGLRPLTYMDGAFHAVRPQQPLSGEQQCR
ncbi:flavin oxidoreductase [Leisingera sp. ANG-Vp]|nr:flavin reductase family protein [Leisingera sp. ANG-Vp]KIC17352.1 flavin oxidoreductase [Leisingera sp. ANG-Vp]